MDIIKRNIILKVISDYVPHNITELAKKIEMPRTTLVRYLNELSEEKTIEKTRSNVVLVKKFNYENKAGDKYKVNAIIKEAIAIEAVKNVNNGDIIFIDGGSTNIHLLEHLNDKSVIIYTNNISLVEKVNSEIFKPVIYMVPGELYKPTSTIIGSLAINFLNRIHIDKAFIGVNSIINDDLLTTNQEESIIKSTIISLSKQTFVLYEKTKINKKGSKYIFGSLKDYKVKGVSK